MNAAAVAVQSQVKIKSHCLGVRQGIQMVAGVRVHRFGMFPTGLGDKHRQRLYPIRSQLEQFPGVTVDPPIVNGFRWGELGRVAGVVEEIYLMLLYPGSFAEGAEGIRVAGPDVEMGENVGRGRS